MSRKKTTRLPLALPTRKKTTRVSTTRSIVLPARKYDRLERLVFWYEATPDEIELSDKTCEDVWHVMALSLDGYVGPQESVAEVRIGRWDLIAVITNELGRETRVPVLPSYSPRSQQPMKGSKK